MLVKYKNKIAAIILIAVIALMGFLADRNFINYEVFGVMNSNYEFTTVDDNDIQLAYAVNFPLKTSLVDLNGFIRNLFNQYEMNEVVKLNNGHLIVPLARFTEEETQYCAEQIINFAQYCSFQGSDFVYVQPPINTDEADKQLPIGIEDYRNENVDGVINLIEDAGINVIDLRQCMKNDRMNLYDYVYKTDHHWNTRGAFYGFQHITEYIEQKTGKSVDSRYTDLNNYKIEVYENWHLGTFGQRVGQYFAGADDYEIIIPDFETKLSNGDGNIYSFEQIAVNWATFSNQDPTNRYTYDHAFTEGWVNTEETVKISALILSDSYFTAVKPYMDLVYSGVQYSYWPYGLKADTIRSMQPEIVIFMPYIYDNNNNKLKYIPPTEG